MLSSVKKTVKKPKKVPDYFVYEIMDSKPIYYRGYEEVLNKRKQPDHIIGSSSLRSVIISYVVGVLHKYLHKNGYWVFNNEVVVYLDKATI